MKAKAILLASVLLVGCQTSEKDTTALNQHAQSRSSATESSQYTEQDQSSSAQWSDESNHAAQQNLWKFIGNELKMQIPNNYRVREQEKIYLKNKSYLHDVTLRAEPYMYWIAGQIKKRNLPMELILLPIVESAFNPHATSNANAAGLWQIVPQTGRNYGLKNNKWYDGRRDVAASTNAALDMMESLNRMFNGDWLLTIAAYNCGEGRVMQAIKENKRHGKPTDFWSLSLPRETSIYVPKMLALSDIIKHSKKYDVQLPKADKTRALARIDIGQQIKLTQAAEMAGLSLTKMKAFNSGYKKGVTAPNGPHYIMVPKRNLAQLKTSLADIKIAPIHPTTELADNSTDAKGLYKVRSGDTLSGIAKRLKVKVGDLKSWNNLQEKSVLNVGETLQVANNLNTNGITYKVRKGDSIGSIARRHGVNIHDIIRWNSVIAKNNDLKPGLKLTLYVPSQTPPGS